MTAAGDPFHRLLDQPPSAHQRALTHIDDERQRSALRRTAAFVDEHMPTAVPIGGSSPLEAKHLLLDHAVDLAPAEGLVLEFGVAAGDTLRRIAARRAPVHGFDSFEGLPEDWRTGFGKGSFAAAPPDVPGAVLHAGWFADTLPRFFAEHPGPIAFAHLDADLYSSTATVLRAGEDRFVAGSVLLFDEYFNYPGWERHEHRAFTEFVDRTGHGFEYVAYNPLWEQVLVRLTS